MSDNGRIAWTNERRRLGDLLPWPRNPRQIKEKQAERLVDSVETFGQVETLAVGPSNEVYNGHQRLDVLMAKYGPDYEVDVRVSSRPLAEKEREKLTVYLHKGAAGEFDFDILANEFELPELLEWGFEEFELGIEPEPKSAGADTAPQIDKADELQQIWQVQLGDIWEMDGKAGKHRIICGDCTDPAVVEAVMGEERADLGVTSPPYAVGKEYELDISFSEHLALLRGLADRALETIKPGGFFFVNFGEIAAQSHTKPLTGSSRQCLYPISKDYWQIFHEERKMDLYAQRIWYKPFNRLQQPFWTYHTSIPHHQEWEHIWTWRLPGGDGDECFDWDISSRAVWDTRQEAIDDKPLTRHTAAFPVCLPERAIKAHSKHGTIIWEPFLGSGTTLIACENLGRICRGVEISEKYCSIVLQRYLDTFAVQPVRVSLYQ